jgi:hypothetical protein
MGRGFVNRLTRSSSGSDNVIVTVPGDAAGGLAAGREVPAGIGELRGSIARVGGD